MPGLRAALPAALLLLLLLLLLSSFPPAAAKRLPWQWIQGNVSMLNPSDHRASRAARVALHFFNYHEASPSGLRGLREMEKVAVKVISKVATKYYMQFTTEDYISGEDAGRCLATVLYQSKSAPEVRIMCAHTRDKKQIHEKDKRFYQNLRDQTKPITAYDIPDHYGHIAKGYLLLWGLAITGSSYMMLEKSREGLNYDMAQVKYLKQWIKKDNVVDFEFMILLHETPTQKIELCHMHLNWIFSHPPRVKYFCALYNHELEDGSGHDSGSAAGMFHEKEGNF